MHRETVHVDFSSRRTASPFQSALAAFPGQQIRPGASSYFTAPTQTLDPNIFNQQERIRPQVRSWLLSTIASALHEKGFRASERWLRVWIAGSGASYQWSAARDPGDLDILLGVDYPRFREANIEYTGMSDAEISDDMNEALQSDLWKRTANQQIGDSHYEVTWFVNPGSTDIRNIHPYAAYDVGREEWTVRPIDLPLDGPSSWFPKEYDAQAQADLARAQEIIARYDAAAAAANDADPGRRQNALTALNAAARDAVALFDEIHLGRHAAFDETGEGYRDFANYRWQRGKQLGLIPALRAIKDAVNEARKDAEHALYGGELKSTEHVLTAAALRRSR